MKRNFLLSDSIAINLNGLYLDLHNCYDCESIKINIERLSTLSLTFSKTQGDWVKESLPEKIFINFEKVTFLEMSPEIICDYSTNIERIGFKAPDDRDYDWLLEESQSSSESHIVFDFDTGNYIRLYSESINIEILHST